MACGCRCGGRRRPKLLCAKKKHEPQRLLVCARSWQRYKTFQLSSSARAVRSQRLLLAQERDNKRLPSKVVSYWPLAKYRRVPTPAAPNPLTGRPGDPASETRAASASSLLPARRAELQSAGNEPAGGCTGSSPGLKYRNIDQRGSQKQHDGAHQTIVQESQGNRNARGPTSRETLKFRAEPQSHAPRRSQPAPTG